jgi:protein-glucosylgalactosylhydroxylysine glucosidase
MASTTAPANSPIDRQDLVQRHNPILTAIDPMSPLSVGNGEFAFSADVTGLQSFPDTYLKGTPLCTMSQWGWHTRPPPAGGFPPLRLASYDAHGRTVHYATDKSGQEAEYNYLRESPQRLHLGQIGFSIHTRDGRLANPSDLKPIRQELDLWTGAIESQFSVDNAAAIVTTCCHPARDAIFVDVSGRLLSGGWMSVVFRFPGPSSSVSAADWDHSERHTTTPVRSDKNSVVLGRKLDGDGYFVNLAWSDGTLQRRGDHEWELIPAKGATQFRFWCEFGVEDDFSYVPDADAAFDGVGSHWQDFWSRGGVVDFSSSSDPRAEELERRVVLSQYLTAIQCSGSLPPQETGLTCNSWYGKFHLEMHFWHAAHFALWGRSGMLEKSLDWYTAILPSARERAKSNGYAGARWPKMTDPSGRDSPSPIGPLLIWEQPHPIVYAEWCYRAHPDAATLAKYGEFVQATAEFMASYAVLDNATKKYVLGPPVIPAQENHPARQTWNPTFELSYWRHGLKIAQQWRRRQKMEPIPLWDQIVEQLSPLPVVDGVYLAHENCPQTYTEKNHDHPSMLAALGVLPGDGVDPETMRRTLKKVMEVWDWPSTWGWDYPMAAMTAARLGDGKLAIDLLLLDTPKNHYRVNGHNYQRPDLSLYLPGNGGLLTAIAMMAAGWDGGPQTTAPGFPSDGSWNVQAEGLLTML